MTTQNRQPTFDRCKLRTDVAPPKVFNASRRRVVVPGLKHITVEAPGYFPHNLDADLPVGVTTVKIKLRPVPP